MRKISFCSALALAILLSLVPHQTSSAKFAVSPSRQSSAYDLIAEVNALRTAYGLPAYTVNSILMGTAQAQADYMAAIGSVTHAGPGGIGLTQRLLNAGYPLAGDLSQGGFRAENITGGNKTAAQAIQEWTGDALHLNTMLSPNLTEIGAGVARVGDRYYMVIDCARPTTSGQPQEYTPGSDAPAVGTSVSSDFIVPITTSTPDEKGLVYHDVQYGQTLWAIAIAYGVKIDQIRALNNLGSATDIYQGDKLLIREDAPPSLSTTSSAAVVSPTLITFSATSPSFPTATPASTEAPLLVSEPVEENNSITGIAVGIVLVTLLLAGMFTWLSSRRSV